MSHTWLDHFDWIHYSLVWPILLFRSIELKLMKPLSPRRKIKILEPLISQTVQDTEGRGANDERGAWKSYTDLMFSCSLLEYSRNVNAYIYLTVVLCNIKLQGVYITEQNFSHLKLLASGVLSFLLSFFVFIQVSSFILESY